MQYRRHDAHAHVVRRLPRWCRCGLLASRRRRHGGLRRGRGRARGVRRTARWARRAFAVARERGEGGTERKSGQAGCDDGRNELSQSAQQRGRSHSEWQAPRDAGAAFERWPSHFSECAALNYSGCRARSRSSVVNVDGSRRPYMAPPALTLVDQSMLAAGQAHARGRLRGGDRSPPLALTTSARTRRRKGPPPAQRSQSAPRPRR